VALELVEISLPTPFQKIRTLLLPGAGCRRFPAVENAL
jgi:hypothetical protein